MVVAECWAPVKAAAEYLLLGLTVFIVLFREWEPGYRRREYAAPGLGLKDFAKDVQFIYNARRRRQRLGSKDQDLEQQPDQEDSRPPSPDGLIKSDENYNNAADSLALEENQSHDELAESSRTSGMYQATLQ